MKAGSATFVSVVVCTYNRADELARTLAGLAGLRYPSGRYEVIVVDDGSTDRTESVARAHGVVYRKHECNLGIPYARNTGLLAARGDIVAFIDDDCIPHEDWLEQLILGYRDERIIAVGGAVRAREVDSLTACYLYDGGYGRPILFDVEQRRGLVHQFLAYLRIRWAALDPRRFERITRASELTGANVSFRRHKALEIGGYDENLQVLEDIDLSLRLREHNPGAWLLYNPHAVVSHRYPDAFLPYLRKSFRWGRYLLQFQRKRGRPTPIYPFPLAWVAGNAVAWLVTPALLALSAPLLAYLFYFQWPLMLLQRRKWRYALFPFMQLLIEFCTALGVSWSLLSEFGSARWMPARKQVSP